MGSIKQPLLGLLLSMGLSMPLFAEDATEPLVVYRSASCGCCGDWVDYLREEGFKVETRITDELGRIKRMAGVPASHGSCHTGLIGGRFVEGHVPASAVRWLLQAPSSVRGVTVPGMPLGSPGMEMADGRKQPFKVLAIDDQGRKMVVSEHK